MGYADPERQREYRREWQRKWRAANPDAQRERIRTARLAMIAAYGGACECCGESTPEFLTLEHKGGVVPEHHRTPAGNRKAGAALYAVVAAEGYPDTYGLLCFNCNIATGHYGVCPHQRQLKAVV